MSDAPLLVSAEEMLATAKLQLADIRFDHLSIDLVDSAPPTLVKTLLHSLSATTFHVAEAG